MSNNNYNASQEVTLHNKTANRLDVRKPGSTLGLSTAHICTLSNATFWVGGSLVRVQRNNNNVVQNGGGRRGNITSFSRQSRKRFLNMLGKVNNQDTPLFLTLTFPDEFHGKRLDRGAIKSCARRFQMKFIRRFKKGSYIWRLEGATRKSGKYIGDGFRIFICWCGVRLIMMYCPG
jgi:hypothetical protein